MNWLGTLDPEVHRVTGHLRTTPPNRRRSLRLGVSQFTTFRNRRQPRQSHSFCKLNKTPTNNARWGRTSKGDRSGAPPRQNISQEKCSPTLPGPRLPSLSRPSRQGGSHHKKHLTRETFFNMSSPWTKYSRPWPKRIRRPRLQKHLPFPQATSRPR